MIKEILLVLINDCKWYVAAAVGFLVFVVFGIQAVRGDIDLDYIGGNLIFYIFFLVTLWNVELVYMPSVDEDSTGAIVFSRWGLILVSLSMLLYFLIEPFM